MHISSRDFNIVLMPRSNRCLKELSSTISLWSSALLATESSPRCCFVLDLVSFLSASVNEPILFALRFIPVGACGSFSALPREAVDRALCILLMEFPDAMRFMLPRLATRFIDESTSSLDISLFSARLARLVEDAKSPADCNPRAAKSPQLMIRICSSCQCRSMIFPSSTESSADNSRRMAATTKRPDMCSVRARPEAMTLPKIPPRVPPNPTNAKRLSRIRDREPGFCCCRCCCCFCSLCCCCRRSCSAS
mmetsp:Transcript_29394/g.85489  ORF Transcript_29394/g.85489 Transcript_29394/m.85489 type:complete len:251 (+) Transcript_29394:1808-2560(+)